jgi:hypothetical protein
VADGRRIRAAADLADSLTRLAIAADLQGLEFRPLIELAGALGDDLGELYLAIDGDFTAVTLQAPLPADAGQMATFLARHRATFAGQAERFAPLRARQARAQLVELGLGPGGLSCALSSVGPERLADAVELAGRSGFAAPDELADVVRLLSPTGRVDAVTDRALPDGDRLELRIGHDNGAAAAATGDQLVAAAERLGVAGPQVKFLRSTHAIVAGDRRSVAAVSVDRERLVGELVVEYLLSSWQSAVRLVGGFRPGAPVGERLGHWAGALAADRPTAIRISFGAGGMPGCAVWAPA